MEKRRVVPPELLERPAGMSSLVHLRQLRKQGIAVRVVAHPRSANEPNIAWEALLHS